MRLVRSFFCLTSQEAYHQNSAKAPTHAPAATPGPGQAWKHRARLVRLALEMEAVHDYRRKFRSQTSDTWIDGKVEVGRFREDKSRREKIREEKEFRQ